MVVDQLKIIWVQQELLNMRIARFGLAHGPSLTAKFSSAIIKRHFSKKCSVRSCEELAFTPRAKGQHKHRGSHTSFDPEREEHFMPGLRGKQEAPTSMLSMRELPIPNMLPEPEPTLSALVDVARHKAAVERVPVPQILTSEDEEVRTAKGVALWWRLLVKRASAAARKRSSLHSDSFKGKSKPPSYRQRNRLIVPPVVLPRPSAIRLLTPSASPDTPPFPRPALPAVPPHEPSTVLPPRVHEIKRDSTLMPSRIAAGKSSAMDLVPNSRLLHASFYELHQLQSLLRKWHWTCQGRSPLAGEHESMRSISTTTGRLAPCGGRRAAGGGLVTRMQRSKYFAWFFKVIKSRTFWLIFPWVSKNTHQTDHMTGVLSALARTLVHA
ncbi:MAG: hypothetical protein SGPRY_008807, partial [Prymnesium sp.]